jgi:hypothetical protein
MRFPRACDLLVRFVVLHTWHFLDIALILGRSPFPLLDALIFCGDFKLFQETVCLTADIDAAQLVQIRAVLLRDLEKVIPRHRAVFASTSSIRMNMA